MAQLIRRIIICTICTNLTSSFNRESIVNTEEAGILTCNNFYRPSRFSAVELVDKNL